MTGRFKPMITHWRSPQLTFVSLSVDASSVTLDVPEGAWCVTVMKRCEGLLSLKLISISGRLF